MKKNKITVTILLLLVAVFALIPLGGCAKNKNNEKVLKVAMECAYEPFNWTQVTDENGAVRISGTTNVSYGNGYDVRIAKYVADKLGMKLEIYAVTWESLIAGVQAGTYDAIVAGMSPTAERRAEIDFTDAYYESNLVIVYKGNTLDSVKNLADLKGKKIGAQSGTFHADALKQIDGVIGSEFADFDKLLLALTAGTLDGYIAEEPTALSVKAKDSQFKYVPLKNNDTGFETTPENVSVAIGCKKGSPLVSQINEALRGLTQEERETTMAEIIDIQVGLTSDPLFVTIGKIFKNYWLSILTGVGATMLIALTGTIAGLIIGLFIGIIRTIPESKNKHLRRLQKVINWIFSAYIEVFRGTPMMVQAMVIHWGYAFLHGGDTLPLFLSGIVIVSINTGAYMAEIVRGGIISIDKGQYEGASSIGMNHWQIMLHVILPQVFRNILPSVSNEFIVNIKDTSVLTVIGVAELYAVGNIILKGTYKLFATYLVVCVIYFILTFTISRILRLIERKLDGNKNYVICGSQSDPQAEIRVK